MNDGSIYQLIDKSGNKRGLPFKELNQLKMDILWAYDENGEDMVNPFIPTYSLNLKYWEYLNIEGLYESEKDFYSKGVLVIILCMIAGYLELENSKHDFFGDTDFNEITECITKFNPTSKELSRLKELVLFGMKYISTVPPGVRGDMDYKDKRLDEFVQGLRWTEKNIIKAYFQKMSDAIS